MPQALKSFSHNQVGRIPTSHSKSRVHRIGRVHSIVDKSDPDEVGRDQALFEHVQEGVLKLAHKYEVPGAGVSVTFNFKAAGCEQLRRRQGEQPQHLRP